MEYFIFNKLINSGELIHLIGIGGVSMSALSKLLKHKGANVQGSDRTPSKSCEELSNRGIVVKTTHDAVNVEHVSLVIRTSAIHDDNPEIIRAKELNIPIIERAEAWGLIMEEYKNVICLSGTHGKTTTTSMMSHIIMAEGLDPTIMVGSELPWIDGTVRIGKRDFFVAESCEYCNSFLNFKPTASVVLNVEADHLDFFKDIDDIITSFNSFLKLLPSHGVAVVNGDDENALKCLKDVEANVLKFGLCDNNDVIAKNIVSKNGYFSFDVYLHNEFFTNISLSVPGMHNVMNALSCCAVSIHLGLSANSVQKGLKEFSGSTRRFQKIGTINNAIIVDDYAHHPTEMNATFKAAAEMGFSRVICVFQPHTYTRTHALFNDFAKALMMCDEIILSDIYSARETNTIGISSKDFLPFLSNASYYDNFESIENHIRNNAKEGDLIITMGAGNINEIAYNLAKN